MLTVIIGAAASGKSNYAENLLLSFGKRRCFYVATMMVWDEECRDRIEQHKKMREGKDFTALECFLDLKDLVLPKSQNKTSVLLECMSNLTANELYRQDTLISPTSESVINSIMEGIYALKNQSDELVVVTNEVFSAGLEYPQSTVTYLKTLGSINQKLVQLADQTVEVVYGIPIVIS